MTRPFGGRLGERLARRPPLPPADAARKLCRMLAELAELPDLDAGLSRRLTVAAGRLAAERTPTRSTARGIVELLDDLLLELDNEGAAML